MNPFAVELEGVSKSFGGQYAVQPMDLRVPTGSIYGFIGPNGSGKTTTMRMILRIYRPDSGVVRVLGADEGNCADNRVGYLPEERGLYRRMTVKRVLRYFAKLKGLRRPDKKIEQWLRDLGANDWQRKRIDQLSKGMAQKVQFIAAVVADPELVILDEPFSGLDPVNMEVLKDAVIRLRENGTTVIFSTHDMAMAEQMCDRVCMIFRGQKVLDDDLPHLLSTYGEPMIRVRLSSPSQVPSELPGVISQVQRGADVDLRVNRDVDRNQILRALMAAGNVEHFEIVKPTLHDIFVSIAKPQQQD